MKNLLRMMSAFFVVIAILGVFGFSSVAQEGGKIALPRPPETANVLNLYANAFNQEIEQFSFADINTVYLVDAAAISRGGGVSTDAFTEYLSARIVHSWESLEQSIAQAPLDVLIIDGSALDQVDLGWIQSAYRDGTTIIGISIEFEVISAAINDQCAENGGIDISKHFEEWFYYFAYWVRVDPVDAKSIVDHETLERCNNDFDGVLGVAVTHITNSHPLSAAASIEYLADIIRNDLISRKLEGIPLLSQSYEE